MQAKYVAENLGPELRNSKVSNVKIFSGDDQRYTFPWWFQEMEATNPKSLDYVYGFAKHFYVDDITLPDVLDETKKQYPNKVIMNTESCMGSLGPTAHAPLLGSWDRAQQYVVRIMEVSY